MAHTESFLQPTVQTASRCGISAAKVPHSPPHSAASGDRSAEPAQAGRCRNDARRDMRWPERQRRLEKRVTVTPSLSLSLSLVFRFLTFLENTPKFYNYIDRKNVLKRPENDQKTSLKFNKNACNLTVIYIQFYTLNKPRIKKENERNYQ